MKFNFDRNTQNRDGSDIMESDKPVTFSTIILNALDAADTEASGVEKMERHAIATKVFNGGDIELSTEEISKIKSCVGKHPYPLIVGQIFSYIESANA